MCTVFHWQSNRMNIDGLQKTSFGEGEEGKYAVIKTILQYHQRDLLK
ncbi:unnamed protein product [Acanthoscelides obtectus]|uniref:Uncharacterized protein n=1 Tax=Acanthoscelides obtectus TaxID=200917 RepID=A0A9P0JW92_ACAOB|nr:unnamed protein product [Acanthoscelides obtectus]CAK1623766.1 hypothetical protein AOBTE_LOCUS2166 [Acanthoscelides obtectus]